MEYLKILWKHNHRDEPVWLYHEIDDDRWERRKVEIFADGTVGHASEGETRGGSMLSSEPLPPMEEIQKDSEFSPLVISKEEFENVWDKRQENVRD